MMPSGRGKKKDDDEKDEVEEMLRAAQDELLLNLSVNSHTTRLPGDGLLPDDLDRRFESLKSNPRLDPPPARSETPTVPVDDGDLLARFAKLKGEPSSSSGGGGTGMDRGGDEEEEEDEVEKIIRWVQDAARLDPSPPSDVEEEESDDDGVEDDSSDDENPVARRKGQHSGK